MKTILKVAQYYEQKLASVALDAAAVKPLIKQAVETVIDAYPTLMDGVLISTHFRATETVMGPQIVFALWMDKDKKDKLEKTKAKRDKLIEDSLTLLLKKQFGERPYMIVIEDSYR